MAKAGGNWTVMNEMKVGGLCYSPEELDEEATLQQADADLRGPWQPNASVLYKTQAHSNASPDSGRQAIIALSLSEPQSDKPKYPAPHERFSGTGSTD
jgi:hypothetical protein